MKHSRSIVGAFVLLAALFFTAYGPKNYLTCQVIYSEDISISAGPQIIQAEIADTPAARQKGLGGRECINESQGMLFVFDRPGQYAFWMKDMKFPIDIIWIGADKRVVYIEPNVSPDTYPQAFESDEPAQYVLELKASQATRLHIKPDTSLKF